MPSGICIAGIGEVLVDVFEDGKTTVGGAPFNVTFHVHQLLSRLSLGEGIFVSAVGEDEFGGMICRAAEGAGMSTHYLKRLNRTTGSAMVFERQGEAGFEIKPNVAWDCIDLDEGTIGLAERCQAAVFGSLAQRSTLSRDSVRRFVSAVRGPRLYDVNLRQNTTDHVKGYSGEVISESLRLATLVKMNDSEVGQVCRMLGRESDDTAGEEQTCELMEWLRDQFSLDAIAVTRGPRGALFLADSVLLRLPHSQIEQSLVHPVGAGDAFAAGLLFGAVQRWSPQDSLNLADLLSNFVVLHVSATPTLSSEIVTAVEELVARANRNFVFETTQAGSER
jgi:fructokinase